MKTLIGILKKSSILVFILLAIPTLSLACDFSKGVTENPDGTFKYTRECHIEAGKKITGYSLLEEKTFELEKQINIKDLIISKHEERANLWLDTSLKINDKLQTYDRFASHDRWVSFALGFGAAMLSVYVANEALKNR